MSEPLKTEANFRTLADKFVGYILQTNKIKAQQAKEIDDVKKKYSEELGAIGKLKDSLKRRLTNFAKHKDKAPLIFSGKLTGSFKTNHAEVRLKNNPASIKLIDKDADRKHLVSEAKRMGFSNVITLVEDFSIESMEKLTDAELERIGFKRVKENKTLTITSLADSESKDSQKIEPPAEAVA